MQNNKKALLTAAITGVFLAASYAVSANNVGEVGECHGVNACKGQGDCGGIKSTGEKYSCSGNNECKGKGWLKLSKEDCDKKNGTFKMKS